MADWKVGDRVALGLADRDVGTILYVGVAGLTVRWDHGGTSTLGLTSQFGRMLVKAAPDDRSVESVEEWLDA